MARSKFCFRSCLKFATILFVLTAAVPIDFSGIQSVPLEKTPPSMNISLSWSQMDNKFAYNTLVLNLTFEFSEQQLLSSSIYVLISSINITNIKFFEQSTGLYVEFGPTDEHLLNATYEVYTLDHYFNQFSRKTFSFKVTSITIVSFTFVCEKPFTSGQFILKSEDSGLFMNGSFSLIMTHFDGVSSINDGHFRNIQILSDDDFLEERFDEDETNPMHSTYFLDFNKLLDSIETTKPTRTIVSEVTHENRLPRRIIVLIFLLLIVVIFLVPFCFTRSFGHQIE